MSPSHLQLPPHLLPVPTQSPQCFLVSSSPLCHSQSPLSCSLPPSPFLHNIPLSLVPMLPVTGGGTHMSSLSPPPAPHVPPTMGQQELDGAFELGVLRTPKGMLLGAELVQGRDTGCCRALWGAVGCSGCYGALWGCCGVAGDYRSSEGHEGDVMSLLCVL